MSVHRGITEQNFEMKFGTNFTCNRTRFLFYKLWHALDTLGVCGDVRVQSHASYAKACPHHRCQSLAKTTTLNMARTCIDGEWVGTGQISNINYCGDRDS